MTERELILLFLGAATIGTGIALYRQGVLRAVPLAIASAATVAIVSFLIFAYT